MSWFEKGPGFGSGLSDLFKSLTVSTVTAGVIAAVFGLSAGAIHVGAAQQGGLTKEQTIAWLVSLYVINGIGGLIIPLYYKQPISIANSLPGAILLGTVAKTIPFNEIMGGAVAAGVIIFVLGITGAVKTVMRFLPVPIILGMTAGVFLKFGINMITPITQAPFIVILMIVAYLLVSKKVPKFPGILAALIVGFIALLIQGVDTSQLELIVSYPKLIRPEFSLSAVIAYGIPLAVLVIGAENAQAIGALMSQGYQLPINGMTLFSGIGGIISPFFSLHNTNVAGPMTAICASPDAGPKEKRWVAAFIVGVIWVIAGPFYGSIVQFFKVMPPYFVSVVVGVALIRVLVSSIADSIGSSKHRLSSLFAFLIGASGITIWKIGSPFWALVGGMIVALIMEPEDLGFKQGK